MKNKVVGKLKSLKPIHLLVIFLGIVLYFGAIVGVINYQRATKVPAPTLVISTPQEGKVFKTDVALIEGKSDAGATIVVGEEQVQASDDGDFSLSVMLREGENNLKVIATKSGKSTEKNIIVRRKTPVAATKPTTARKSTPAKASTYQSSGTLNNSGPESLWILEAGSLSASAVAWQMSKSRLKNTLAKR